VVSGNVRDRQTRLLSGKGTLFQPYFSEQNKVKIRLSPVFETKIDLKSQLPPQNTSKRLPLSLLPFFFPFMHAKVSPEIARVEELAHTKVADCYQCGKCSAGCPMGDQMDVIPSTLIRLIQYGNVNEAARSAAVWQCVSCQTCSTRCPKSVNIAGVLDALKQISIERKLVHKDFKRVVAFNKAFLDTIRRNGRTNELELVAQFKIRGFLGDFSILKALKDSMLGPKMLGLGKLHLKLGSPVKNKALVKRIFDRCMKQ